MMKKLNFKNIMLGSLLTVALSASLGTGIALKTAEKASAESAPTTVTTQKKDWSKRIGTTHAAGYYSFDPSVSYLEEGAQELADMSQGYQTVVVPDVYE